MTPGDDRWLRILEAAGAGPGRLLNPEALCLACAQVLGVAGIGITLMDPAAAVAGYASNPASQQLGELQFTLGEGPTGDAYSTAEPVEEPDLAGGRPGRWLEFGPQAVTAGIGSVFAFPLQVGVAQVGTLTMYRTETGALGDPLHRATLVAAEMITRLILDWQSAAPAGMLAPQLGPAGGDQAVVHQASGMLSVRLDVGIGEALARLRARSFSSSRTVTAVAADVVAGRVGFER